MDWLTWVSKILPFLDQYPSWVRWMAVVWLLLTASFVGTLVMAPRSAISVVAATVADTGDEVIDGVQKRLVTLKSTGASISESKLSETLTPLFSRPAFYGIREENWSYFLFTLCKTRLLLEENVQFFKTTPRVRAELGRAIELMVRLQNDVANLYGPTFSVTDHISRYIQNRDAFTKNLPPVVHTPDYRFFDARDVTIREIRGILKPLGLTSF